MNKFAELLDRLSYEPGRNAKLRLIADYLRTTPDPERGWALAALTGALTFKHAKAGMIRALIAERTEPELFALSYDYVGDLSETVALMWPTSIPPRDFLSSPPPLRGRSTAKGGREEGAFEGSDSTVYPPPCPSPSRGEGTQEPPRWWLPRGCGRRARASLLSVETAR